MTRKTPTYDFVIKQGEELRIPMTWYDQNRVAMDVTGYTARLVARNTDPADPALLDISDVSGHITVGTTDGTFVIVIPDVETSALDFDKANYQMEITPAGGGTIRFMQGRIRLSRELVT